MEISLKKTIGIIAFVFLAANVLILDFLLFGDENRTEVKSSENSQQQINENSCGEECRDYTDAQIAQLESRLGTNIQTAAVEESVKEIYIPLGSGTSNAKVWANIPGLEASVDTGKYPHIAKSTFEVTVNIPNNNQITWVRLYNQTADHPVWFTEMEYSGGDAGQLITPAIQLDEGNNVYVVQARTQLGYEMQVVNARIHLTLQ